MDGLQNIAALGQTARASASLSAMQDRMAAVARTPNQEKAWAAAQDFEAMFVAQVMEQMTAELPVDGYFGGGHGEQIYRGLLNEQYSKAIAARGGVGIADSIYRVLIGEQELPHGTVPRNPR